MSDAVLDFHPSDLTARLSAYRAEHPKAYLRDAATALNVSELELLLASSEITSVRLRDQDWAELFGWFPRFGPVKTMTRNTHAVIERTGTYADYEGFGAMGQVLGEIDLRVFTREWLGTWAVTSGSGDSVRRSIQVFDRSGDSVHKLFVSDKAADTFAECVRALAMDVQDERVELSRRPVTVERDDDGVDVDAFLARWDAMTDTHQFHGLLREFNLSRTQALRLAGPTRAVRVSASAVQQVLEGAAATGEKIMVFVGNRGIVQIYVGAVKNVMHQSGWLNVLDPGFNLHARDTAFAQSWVVTKQSADGAIRSLEVFAEDGSTIVQLFGKRQEGEGSTPVGFSALLDAVLAKETL